MLVGAEFGETYLADFDQALYVTPVVFKTLATDDYDDFHLGLAAGPGSGGYEWQG